MSKPGVNTPLNSRWKSVRLVKAGRAVPVTAKILGVPTQTLGNWVRLSVYLQIQSRLHHCEVL